MEKNKTFIKKYPEFKGKEIDSELHEGFVPEEFRLYLKVRDVEEILDKDFVRKEDYDGMFYIAEERMKRIRELDSNSIEKQKVKDAIFKNFEGCSHNVHYERVKLLLKELGFE